MDINETLAALRDVKEQREELAAQDRDLGDRQRSLEAELLKFHEQTGLESVKGEGLSVGFDPSALRAAYDPEKWPAIVRWAIDNGHEYIVQRRLSDGKILDLVAEGVELPEGLTLQSYVKLRVRRV